MIRTETIQIKFPQQGWLGAKIKSVIVSRIHRLKPNHQAALKERLSEKFKVVEGKKKP